MMDAKEKQLFDDLYDRLQKQSFDETDVYALYILLREKVDEKSWLRELGDFVAHRKRDRGRMYTNFKVLAEFDKHTMSLNALAGIEGIQQKELYPEIQKSMVELGKPILEENVLAELLLCTFSLLQFTEFADNRMEYIGKLYITITNREIILCADPADPSQPRFCLGILNNTYTKKLPDDKLLDGWFQFDKKPIRLQRFGRGKLKIYYDGILL